EDSATLSSKHTCFLRSRFPPRGTTSPTQRLRFGGATGIEARQRRDLSSQASSTPDFGGGPSRLPFPLTSFPRAAMLPQTTSASPPLRRFGLEHIVQRHGAVHFVISRGKHSRKQPNSALESFPVLLAGLDSLTFLGSVFGEGVKLM